MATDGLVEEYLGKAKEAEAHAARCTDRALRQSWLAMALSYRAMAQHHLDKRLRPAVCEQPAPAPQSEPDPDPAEDV